MLHREHEKLRKEIENAATATETRVEWKREAVEKAAKVAEASTTAKRFAAFCNSKQPKIEEIAGKK